VEVRDDPRGTQPESEPIEALAGDVWRSMAEFTWTRMQGGRAMHHLKSLGLTPGHLKVLWALQPDEALPMGAIAELLSVDPSATTWLIDRLEERKLVERKMLSTDRRVKVVSLTRRGERVKTKVLGDLLEPPFELLALDRERLEALRSALAALPPTPRPFAPRGDGRATGERRGRPSRPPRPRSVVGGFE
jgi:DNA-binding MarR family transcriptional regulator